MRRSVPVEGELQRVFGENLRVERFRRGMSQEELADLLGIHRTLVGAIERGERNLTLRTIERLTAQLELDPLDLLAPPGRELSGERPL